MIYYSSIKLNEKMIFNVCNFEEKSIIPFNQADKIISMIIDK